MSRNDSVILPDSTTNLYWEAWQFFFYFMVCWYASIYLFFDMADRFQEYDTDDNL